MIAATRLVAPGAGEGGWVDGMLVTCKVAPGDLGTLTVVELELPAGVAVPDHDHDDGDVLLYVLDGDVAFRCGGEQRTFTRGGVAWLPRHGRHELWATDDGPARLLAVSTGTTTCVPFAG